MTAQHHTSTADRPVAASRWWALGCLLLAIGWIGMFGSMLGLIGAIMHRRANPDRSSSAFRQAGAAVVIGAIGIALTLVFVVLLSESTSRPS